MHATNIAQQLQNLRDDDYAAFHRKLIPNIDPASIIGIRTPQLRQLAKQLSKDENVHVFLQALPHSTFEENQLHSFIISDIRDYTHCLEEVNLFLPHVDNWATCDQLSPKVFRKHHAELISSIRQWLRSRHEYTVRFGIGMLLEHYLDCDFSPAHLSLVTSVRRNEYYIRMMQAWYLATALAKQYDATISCLQSAGLDKWVHNKAIQKAIESRRITDEKKQYLKTLKR